ncbi:MAG: metallophosphoesterase [Bacilli bacterium]|nr:metallophosphoesterase [Bacilli bacterium]
MRKVTIDKYEVNATKLDKKLLVVSDIHYCSKKDSEVLDLIWNAIKDNKYDYILIPGDFINNSKIEDEEIFISFLTNLASVAPVILSIGNHDIALGKHNHKTYWYNEDLFNKIKSIKHVHLLDNDIYKKDGIRFIGLTLPLDYYKYHENKNYFMRYTNNNFKSLSKTYYNILLCHSPRFFEDEKMIREVPLLDNISLIVSGHLHAGLVPRKMRKTFKGKGFVDPNHFLCPKRCYGFHHLKDKKIAISPAINKFPSSIFLGKLNRFYAIELMEITLK